jgi:hypothetical protein
MGISAVREAMAMATTLLGGTSLRRRGRETLETTTGTPFDRVRRVCCCLLSFRCLFPQWRWQRQDHLYRYRQQRLSSLSRQQPRLLLVPAQHQQNRWHRCHHSHHYNLPPHKKKASGHRLVETTYSGLGLVSVALRE